MQAFIDFFHQALSFRYDTSERNALLRLIAEEVWGYSYARFLLDKNSDLSESLRQKGEEILARLIKGEPIQYILGQTVFCGLSLSVAPGVLIPRPETEEIIGLIREQFASSNQNLRILDIGTGSGCIALALAHYFPKATVTAWDISEEALRQARKNAERLHLQVEFQQVDILRLPPETNSISPFDLIVSNPPYVLESEAETMQEHVLFHEPHAALFVPDNDPLRFYQAIGNFGLKHLTEKGMLWLEINALFPHETSQLLCQLGYQSVTQHRDLSGKMRSISALR